MGYNLDKPLILEFNTQEEAQTCLNALNSIYMSYYEYLGYGVEDNIIVGKNSKTGNFEPTKQTTTSWDTVKISPDNTYYFKSPTGNNIFYDWKNIINVPNLGAEKIFPKKWKKLF